MTKAAAVKELKAKILAKRPILAGLFERFRGVTVAEYDRVLAPSAAPADPARKQEFIQAVSEEAGRHFPAEAAASVAAQLQDEYMVSTAEHHGPLTHPFFVHSNLLAAAKPRKNIIIFGRRQCLLKQFFLPARAGFPFRRRAAASLAVFPLA